jgi:peptidoglycan/xylan/chitin deacetylase (PgdA/CDA1 family)
MKGSTLVVSALLVSSLAVSCELVQEAPTEEEIIQGWEEALQDPAREEGKEDSGNCKYAIKVPDLPRGKIALTFDDGPNRSTTTRVLDILKAHNAPATFFVLGSKVAGNEDILRRMVDEGHHVGNHTYTHLNAHQVSLAKETGEIDRTQALVSDYAGGAMYMRFPYGNSTCDSRAYVEDLGYHVVGWHIDSCDWDYTDGRAGSCVPEAAYRDGSMFLDWVVKEARSMGGGVILFHDIHANTANKLDAILTALEAAGFSFVALDGRRPPRIPRPQAATAQPTTWRSRAAAAS